jgi:hypothetical protein
LNSKPADGRTLRACIRLQSVESIVGAIVATAGSSSRGAEPVPVLVQGSAALSLRDSRFPRTPADLDLAVCRTSDFAILEGVDATVGGNRVQVVGIGAVPFRPGRDTRQTRAYAASVSDTAGGPIDRILVEVTADERRVASALTLGNPSSGLKWLGCLVQPTVYALADKYHSYMRERRDGRINMRWMDLVDCYYIWTSERYHLSANSVRHARDTVLSWDRGSSLHDQVPVPHTEWAAAWRKLAAIDFPELGTMEEAHTLFETFWSLPNEGGPDMVWRNMRWEER